MGWTARGGELPWKNLSLPFWKLLVCKELSSPQLGVQACHVLSHEDPVTVWSFLTNVMKCRADSAIKYLRIYFTSWAEPYCHPLYLMIRLTERHCNAHLMGVWKGGKLLSSRVNQSDRCLKKKIIDEHPGSSLFNSWFEVCLKLVLGGTRTWLKVMSSTPKFSVFVPLWHQGKFLAARFRTDSE